MGTFHHDRGELHGITVVVDTNGPRVYVGRCDTVEAQGVVLLDADVHEDGADGRSKQDWVQRAALIGVWARHPRLVVPMSEVSSIRKLGELA